MKKDKEKTDWKNVIIFAFVIFSVATICFLVGLNLNLQLDRVRGLDGMWKGGILGDWVMINVKGMDFERAVEVCKHEVGHEIFAEVCENDWEKCAELTK